MHRIRSAKTENESGSEHADRPNVIVPMYQAIIFHLKNYGVTGKKTIVRMKVLKQNIASFFCLMEGFA